ncbi:MAG: cell division protein ZipA C-terminal FtsZ-binding domain-containing protein [Sphingomonadaceae bacterium]
MTQFQLGLLAVGALAVIGVVVYNKLLERAARRKAEQAFGSGHEDVLLGDSSERREPTLEPATLEPAHRKPEREDGERQDALPDPRLDYILELHCRKPVPPAVFLEHWAGIEHRFGWRALAAGATPGGSWRKVASGERDGTERYRAALQLVSRAGVTSEAELIEFRSEVENMASRLEAIADAPEMKQALESARETDRFCAEADIQVVFHLVPPAGGGFAPQEVEAAVIAAGFTRGSDGRRARRDARGAVLYEFAQRDRENGAAGSLSLALDVPHVADLTRTFQSMARCARQLAGTLGASLVDDNGRPLDDRSLAAIERELDAVRRSLEEHGLPPGGALAARLFA